MKPSSLILIAFTCLAGIMAAGQDTIYWKPAYRLKWEDFKGKTEYNSRFQALTSTGLTYTVNYTNNITNFEVSAFFVRPNSWRKPTADSNVLRHEQGHFNITEIFARQLRKAIKNLKPGNKPIEDLVDELSDKIILEKNAFQEKYDQETNYGLNYGKQMQWEQQILKLLE